MAKIKINCLNCEKETYVETREINRGFGKFCSKKCCGAHKSKNKKIKINNVSCAYCKVQFYLNKSKRRNSKSGLYFCCREHKDLSQRIGDISNLEVLCANCHAIEHWS